MTTCVTCGKKPGTTHIHVEGRGHTGVAYCLDCTATAITRKSDLEHIENEHRIARRRGLIEGPK